MKWFSGVCILLCLSLSPSAAPADPASGGQARIQLAQADSAVGSDDGTSDDSGSGTGQGRCYFNSCDNNNDAPSSSRRSTRTQPLPDNPEDNPYPEGNQTEEALPPPQPVIARFCLTEIGRCLMGQAILRGMPCYCPTVYGPIAGVGQ